MNIETVPVGRLGTNCYLVASEQGNCAIIDPGAHPEKIIQAVTDRGFSPAMILLTHGHFDHIGGVKELCDHYEGLAVYISAEELGMLKSESIARWGKAVEQSGRHILEAAHTLSDDQILPLDELSIRAIATPGHTPGGTVFVCGEAMFSGDTLFLNDVGRCDLAGGRYAALKRSLAKLTALPGDFTVYPGHGEETTLDYERRNNIYIREPMPREDS